MFSGGFNQLIKNKYITLIETILKLYIFNIYNLLTIDKLYIIIYMNIYKYTILSNRI